jgi:hypothetical protein
MGETPPALPTPDTTDLETAVAALRQDYSKLAARIRALTHSVTCECSGVVLRLHFPAFRQSKPTVQELIDAIIHYLAQFALPRSDVKAVDDLYGKIAVADFKIRHAQLMESAKSLFIRANEATNRNGEAGELLLYLLTEWILGAPQLIAKMSLKTNREMPVHGADGVHVKYSKKDGKLLLYWGESKLFADVGQAIAAAVASITDALKPDRQKHEIELVQRNISFSGLDTNEREALLKYLDPFDETYNERHDVTTCLIGFDFDGFSSVSTLNSAKAEGEFVKLAQKSLAQVAPKLAKALKAASLGSQPVELFFFPVPSVQELRDLFQEKIGWKQ